MSPKKLSDDGVAKLFAGIKGVAIDMDGTLLSTKHKADPETISAMVNFQEKVGMALIATGRPRFDAQLFLPKEHFDLSQRPGVYVNGAMVVGTSGEIIHETVFQNETAVTAINWILDRKKNGVSSNQPVLVGATNNFILDKSDEWGMHLHTSCGDAEPLELGERWKEKLLAEEKDNQLKVFVLHCVGPAEELGDDVIADWQSTVGDSCVVFRTIPTAISMTVKGRDGKPTWKASGLQKLFESCKGLGLSMDNILAIGDSTNDFDMIKDAKVGCAVGNANDLIMHVADVVTETNDDLGVKHVLDFACEHAK